ncbi:MAG: glycosyltransferase family 1 protein, partial [Selenomonas sp.]|nr:glycosyltransferase family 1 protein [Selenomonas sp.]
MNNQQRMRCKDVAERWRRRFLIESSHVRKVFWGTQGVRAAYLRQKFQPFMETCDMFIDEEPSLQGQMINGLFVCMPESLKDIREKIVIIVLSEDYAKVRGMLRDYGYVENVDFVEGRHLLGEDENGYIEVPYVEKNDGSMIVYGQGAHLADMLKWHPELANCIFRVIDKDHRKIGALISELNVIIEPPEVLKDLPNGTEVVISAIEHIEEIKTEIYSYQPELICWDIDTAWQEMFLGNANDAYDVSLLNQKKYIGILTTKHCLYIAELLKDNISARGFDCEIFIDDDKMDLESEDLYIVICPQMYKCLPKNYIAFQLEQSVSSRWFNDEYIARLKKSIAIFEYSLTNIDYLQTQGIPFGKIFYMPISPEDKTENKENHKYEYDVLFYGDVHSDRREKFLDKIQEKFDVKIISNLFAEELKRELGKAKIVLNIHFYEGAVLETTRLSEVLSIGRSLIISERSSEENLDNQFKDCVDFVEVNDVDKMIERIGFWLSDSDRLKRKVKSVNNNRKNIFTFFFNRFLLAKNLISFDDFYNNTASCFDFAGKKICLNLPESVDRRRYFDSINRYGFQYFPGLRHDIGWIG